MKRKSNLRSLRRMIILPAVMILTLVFVFAPVMEVNAASGEKTFYIPTVLTSRYSDSDGDNAIITETREFTDEGLYMSRSIGDKDGLYNRYSVSIRDGNGRTLQEQQYSDSGLDGTYTYTYWKNGRIKNVVYQPVKGNSYKWSFNKKGYIAHCSYTEGRSTDTYSYKYKFNKKGDPTSIVMKWKTKEGSKKAKTRLTIKTKVKNTYIKKGKNKGKLSKQVLVARGSKINRSSTTETTTIQNKYDGNGRLIQTITTTKRKDSDGDSHRDKEVTTYQYKTVKAPEKYWKACKYAADGTMFRQMGIEANID